MKDSQLHFNTCKEDTVSQMLLWKEKHHFRC